MFAALHRALEERLAAGRLAVIDATNVTAAGRREIRERARRTGTPVIAIVLDLAGELIHGRNATRPDRQVPGVVVERHLATLAGTLEHGALETEGYARVVVLRDPAEVAGVLVRVLPAAGG